jgi:molecular chaperone GrpE
MSKRKPQEGEELKAGTEQPIPAEQSDGEEVVSETSVSEDVAAAINGDEAAQASDDIEIELEKAKTEAAENMDKFMRAAAELENTRRRAQIDVANAHKYALDKFATEILMVRDSLEQARVLEATGDADALSQDAAVGKMLEGIDLTLKQLDSVFEKFQLSIIDPQGEKFDPEKHQAMSLLESDEADPNHVLQVIQKGCMLNDRLLRPAMVIVAKEKSDDNQVDGS